MYMTFNNFRKNSIESKSKHLSTVTEALSPTVTEYKVVARTDLFLHIANSSFCIRISFKLKSIFKQTRKNHKKILNKFI